MEEKILEQILHLASEGYEVSFSKVDSFKPASVLRIELRKGDKHHVEFVDISIETSKVLKVQVPHLVSRSLHRADWNFKYDFEREKINE